MKWLENWKAKRKAKKEARGYSYDTEEARLLIALNKQQPGTDTYKELQKELREINQMRDESRESRRRVSKSDRGGIIMKLLGIAGGAVGLFSIIKAERDGMTFTGQKRTIMDAISRTIGNILHKG